MAAKCIRQWQFGYSARVLKGATGTWPISIRSISSAPPAVFFLSRNQAPLGRTTLTSLPVAREFFRSPRAVRAVNMKNRARVF